MTDRTGDERQPALRHAEAGAEAWRAAARDQLRAAADHADFYALAGEAVTTLHALDDLLRVVREQVASYAHGRPVYDDSGQVAAVDRLEQAAAAIDATRGALERAEWAANGFWSAIGHIGVEVQP
jgi:hypothetical protein